MQAYAWINKNPHKIPNYSVDILGLAISSEGFSCEGIIQAIRESFNLSRLEKANTNPVQNQEVIDVLSKQTYTNKEEYAKLKDFVWNVQKFEQENQKKEQSKPKGNK